MNVGNRARELATMKGSRVETSAKVVVSSLWLDRNVANRWIPATGRPLQRAARLLQMSRVGLRVCRYCEGERVFTLYTLRDSWTSSNFGGRQAEVYAAARLRVTRAAELDEPPKPCDHDIF